MTRLALTRRLAAILLATFVMSGCGSGGGSTPGTPMPSPAPTPTPTPTPGATLQTLANQPPVGVLLALLLTDGSVMVQANPDNIPGASAADFYRLVPDASGSYAAGSWTHLASPPAGYAPYASAEAVLADGRVLFVGGEYNQDNYSFGPTSLTSPTHGPGSVGYGPAPLQVVGGVTYGPAPAGVYFPPGEIGPALLRPDGSVFATGSAAPGQIAHTAIYRPGATPGVAGSWLAGPDFPPGEDSGDSSAALLPNGNVLVAGITGALYEFDGTTLRKTASGPTNPGGGVPVFLLPLPTGQVLVLTPTLNVMARLYIPLGGPLAAWLPTISSVPTSLTRGQSYALTGTQLNGLSEGAAYGDELSAATNYPLVRLTNNASGHMVYARTHHHGSMGVATGATAVTTHFDVPATAEAGAATLVVVVNGIASAPVTVTIS